MNKPPSKGLTTAYQCYTTGQTSARFQRGQSVFVMSSTAPAQLKGWIWLGQQGNEEKTNTQTHRTVRIQKDSSQEVQHSYYIQSNREAGYCTQLNKKVVLLHTRRQGNYIQLNKEANSIEEQPSGHKHRVGVRRQLWWAISAYIINILLTSTPGPRKALPSLYVSLGNGGGGLVVGGCYHFPTSLGHWSPWHGCACANSTHSLRASSLPHVFKPQS